MLDKIDMMIMEELEDDARQSVRALARKLGLNSATVHYRLNRLRAEHILTVACIGNPWLLGYEFLIITAINVSPGKADAVTDQLMALPDVKALSLAAGPYSIMAWVFLRDRSDLERFVSESLSGISDITDVEIMHAYKWVKEAWRYFKPQIETIGKYLQRNLSDLDLSIVRVMQLDPAQTIIKLAQTVGCSKSVAKMSLEKLLEDGVIRIVSIVDATALGYNIDIGILIKCKPDKTNAVASELSMQDTVRHVSLVTGQWQLFVWAQFQDNSRMYNFLSQTLTSIPGVIKFDVIHLGKKWIIPFFRAEQH